MRRRLLWLLFPFLVPVMFAQTYTTVTASKVQDGSGNLLTQGSICFSPYNSAGVLTAITPVGGSASTGPFCYTITGGAFTTVGATPQLPNLATASPSGLNYQATVYNQTAGLVLQVNWLTSLNGATVNWDQTVVPLSLNALATSAGMGAPYLACAAGASFVSTTNTSRPNWQCAVTNGYPQWFQSGSSPAPGPGQTATIPVVQAMINQALGGGSSIPAPGASGTAPVSNGSTYQTTSVLLGSARGAASGVAPLNASSQVPAANLPTCATGVNHGAGVVPDPGTTSTGKFLRDDCTFAAVPAGGSPGGATYSMQVNGPGSTFQGTGYKTDVTYSDILGVRNLTGANTNDIKNPDLSSGTAATLAACPANDCTVHIPGSSTDNWDGDYPTLPLSTFHDVPNSRVVDNRVTLGGIDYVEDPTGSGIAHTIASTNARRLFNGATGQYGGGATTLSILNFEAAPGDYTYPGHESGGTEILSNCYNYSLGINQCGIASYAGMFGGGDKVMEGYKYNQWGDCGWGNGDDEECLGEGHHWDETSGAVYTATINSIDASNNGLRVTPTVGGNTPGQGRPVLLTKTAAGADAGVLSGCTVTGEGTYQTTFLTLTVSGCSLPVSTAIGTVASGFATPRNLSYATSQTGVVNIISGSFNASQFACFAGVNTGPSGGEGRFEPVRLTAVGTAGTTQSLTGNMIENFSQGQVLVMQGPLCETYARELSGNRSTGANPVTVTFPVVGATDSTHLVYAFIRANGFRKLSDMYNDAYPTVYNVTLYRVSNVVYAVANGLGVLANTANAVVASTADPSFNGTFTAQPSNNMTYGRTAGTVQWAQTAADSTAGVAGTITVGTTTNGLSIYKGTYSLGVVNPSPVAQWQATDYKVGNYLYLHDNDIAWAANQTVEMPLGIHGNFAIRNDYVNVDGVGSTGHMIDCNGAGCENSPSGHLGGSVNWVGYTAYNSYPYTNYQGLGGRKIPPTAFATGGVFGTIVDIGFDPSTAWTGMAPGSTVIRVHCGTGTTGVCDQVDAQYFLFQSDTHDTVGTNGSYMLVDQANDDIQIHPADSDGSIAGLHMIQNKLWFSTGTGGGSAGAYIDGPVYISTSPAGEPASGGAGLLDIADQYGGHITLNTGAGAAVLSAAGTLNVQSSSYLNFTAPNIAQNTNTCLGQTVNGFVATGTWNHANCVTSITGTTGQPININITGNGDTPAIGASVGSGYYLPTTADQTKWNKSLPALQAVTPALSLAVSTCGSTTVAIAGLTQTMDIHATAQVDPGAGTVINAYWTTPNIAKVEVCTPATIAWTNVVMNVVATGN